MAEGEVDPLCAQGRDADAFRFTHAEALARQRVREALALLEALFLVHFRRAPCSCSQSSGNGA